MSEEVASTANAYQFVIASLDKAREEHIASMEKYEKHFKVRDADGIVAVRRWRHNYNEFERMVAIERRLELIAFLERRIYEAMNPEEGEKLETLTTKQMYDVLVEFKEYFETQLIEGIGSKSSTNWYSNAIDLTIEKATRDFIRWEFSWTIAKVKWMLDDEIRDDQFPDGQPKKTDEVDVEALVPGTRLIVDGKTWQGYEPKFERLEEGYVVVSVQSKMGTKEYRVRPSKIIRVAETEAA